MQIITGADSAFVRDHFVNTLHFNGVGTFANLGETNAQSLTDDLASVWQTLPNVGTIRQVKVKAYDLDDAKPRPIIAETTRNAGAFPASSKCPREVALCLSYYADRNLPRQRGRIYVPAELLTAAVGVRPNSAQMTNVKDLHQKFADLGGADVEWSVFSRMDNVHRQVQHSWVDDEWDTVRSRGLRATTRMTTTSEG